MMHIPYTLNPTPYYLSTMLHIPSAEALSHTILPCYTATLYIILVKAPGQHRPPPRLTSEGTL